MVVLSLAAAMGSRGALVAEEAYCEGGRGLVICTNQCPSVPELVCESFGCGGGGYCDFDDCNGFPIAINCFAGN